MSQDNKKSFVMYQGDGSNNVFSVPMTKGKYGTISVAFVRRGLDQYEYNPDTWGLNGGLFAWDLSGTKVYTDTATPAIGATIYDQYGVDTGDTVTAVGGATITVNTNVYTRDTLHDVDENTVLTWTGNTLQIGDYIVIERTTTRTQPFEFQNNQKHIEKSDDNLERQIQEVADKVDNALLVDPTHTIDSNKMNPVEWMQTILRSVDKSVRGFRYLNGWLDYSLDDPNIADVDKTWVHLLNTDNIKAIREQSRIEDGETIYWTEYLAQDGTWKILSDPHKWDNMKLSDLADTDFTNLSAGNFIMFDGLKWKNVNSSATASWGTLIGDITAQTDLMNKFTEYVRTDGTSVMTAPLLMRATDDFKCAIAPYWDGVGFFKLNNNNSVTLIASLEYQDSFAPAENNVYNIGSTSKKWKNLYLAGKAYMSVINNGYDIAVPVTNSADTLALKSEVDLAANSGDQLTEKGVWYAKMYSATVAPSAEDGTNYADFSQTDGQGNPIIVIYKRQNGAWVQDQTITPPAEYNGYVPVTSKIWDIVEQSGQQGGKVLWSHNQKTFTPSPLIISFEDIEITGDSTVVMPATPKDNSIPTKKYVDDKFVSQTYHPGLFAHEWDDHLRNDVQWLRADTFSWQNGSMYQAAYRELLQDMYIKAQWAAGGSIAYTRYRFPEVGQMVYSNSSMTTEIGAITETDGSTYIVANNTTYSYQTGVVDSYNETIAGTTISYALSTTGRKVVFSQYESNVAAIYAATGVAWYYVVDTANQRFKLPRINPDKAMLIANSIPVITGSRHANTGGALTWKDGNNNDYGGGGGAYLRVNNSVSEFANMGNVQPTLANNVKPDNLYADSSSATSYYAGKKYLYFYVGSFTQTALENTAGVTTEVLNDKVDKGHQVIAFQAPTAGNNYTWYRKYADGWVEQGGRFTATSVADGSGTAGNNIINLPITMANNKYWYSANIQVGSNGWQYANGVVLNNRSTTTLTLKAVAGTGDLELFWEVKGMAA